MRAISAAAGPIEAALARGASQEPCAAPGAQEEASNAARAGAIGEDLRVGGLIVRYSVEMISVLPDPEERGSSVRAALALAITALALGASCGREPAAEKPSAPAAV